MHIILILLILAKAFVVMNMVGGCKVAEIMSFRKRDQCFKCGSIPNKCQ